MPRLRRHGARWADESRRIRTSWSLGDSTPWRTLVGVAVMVAASIAMGVAPASATTKSVVIANVSVTAALAGRESAVVMDFENQGNSPISLLSVTSAAATSSMIDYDANMCQGNHAMVPLANIFVNANHAQQLGYQYQGAMLSGLRQNLSRGERITLVVTWSDFAVVHHSTVMAKVVAPPKGIKFTMGNMKM